MVRPTWLRTCASGLVPPTEVTSVTTGRKLPAEPVLDDLDRFGVICSVSAIRLATSTWIGGVELDEDLGRAARIEVRQDDRDRLRMLVGQQAGGLHRVDVTHEVERDDLLGLVDALEELVGLALAERLTEQFQGVVLAARQDAGVGEQAGVGLFKDGVADRTSRRPACASVPGRRDR